MTTSIHFAAERGYTRRIGLYTFDRMPSGSVFVVSTLTDRLIERFESFTQAFRWLKAVMA